MTICQSITPCSRWTSALLTETGEFWLQYINPFLPAVDEHLPFWHRPREFRLQYINLFLPAVCEHLPFWHRPGEFRLQYINQFSMLYMNICPSDTDLQNSGYSIWVYPCCISTSALLTKTWRIQATAYQSVSSCCRWTLALLTEICRVQATVYQ